MCADPGDHAVRDRHRDRHRCRLLIGDSVDKIEIGTRQAGNAGALMTDIAAQVKRVRVLHTGRHMSSRYLLRVRCSPATVEPFVGSSTGGAGCILARLTRSISTCCSRPSVAITR